MPKYIVHVREVWVQPIEVEADSPDDAQDRIWAGEGVQLDNRFEFSHCLERGTWTVEEVEGEVPIVHPSLWNDGHFSTGPFPEKGGE